MLPIFPFIRPICVTADGKARSRAGDLRTNLDAEFAQLEEAIIDLDVIVAAGTHVHGFVTIAEIGPVDVGQVERIGAQRGPTSDEGSLIGHPVADG